MSNFSTSIPVANLQAANAFLAGTDGDPLNLNNFGPDANVWEPGVYGWVKI